MKYRVTATRWHTFSDGTSKNLKQVRICDVTTNYDGTKRVSENEFGESRDYQVLTDQLAIDAFFAEHNCKPAVISRITV